MDAFGIPEKTGTGLKILGEAGRGKP